MLYGVGSASWGSHLGFERFVENVRFLAHKIKKQRYWHFNLASQLVRHKNSCSECAEIPLFQGLENLRGQLRRNYVRIQQRSMEGLVSKIEVSLLLLIGPNRDCNSMGFISRQFTYCACANRLPLALNSRKVQEAAHAVLDCINRLIANCSLCAQV